MKFRVVLSAIFSTTLMQAQDVLAQDTVISLDSVVVSANKREQGLSKIDGSVSVKTGEDLQRANVTKVSELGKVFSGLVIRTRGSRVYANFTVRGQYSPDFYNAAVQIYVDGVPQDTSVFDQELINVDRVEFLRGPQGTLYGRNAFGGVINIITRRPRTDELAVAGELSDHGRRADIVGTAALSPDSWFLDFAGRAEYDEGHIKDATTNNSDIADTRSAFGSAMLRFDPQDGPFDATLAASYDRVQTHEELYLLDQFVSQRKYFTAFQPVNYLDREFWTTSLNWNYQWDGFTLSSTSAYQDVSYDRSIFGGMFPETKQVASEELKLAYDGAGRLSGVAGLYLQDDEFTREVVGFSFNKVEGQSIAVFGDATFQVTPRLDVMGGIRYGEDEASISFNAPGFFAFRNSESFDDVQTKAAVGFQITENARVYALVSEGYKPGGFNRAVASPADIAPYLPETSVNYEVGVRKTMLNQALYLAAAAYYIPSEDKQIFVGPVGAQVIRNVGEATSKGVELEANLQASSNLTITGATSIDRSEFDSYVDRITSANHSGNRVPYAPEVTANLSARYILPQTRVPADISLYGALQYTSKVFFDEANTLSQSPVTTFDASVDLAFHNGVTVSVFGTNLTDETYRTSSFNFGGIISTIGDGRVVGGKVKATF